MEYPFVFGVVIENDVPIVKDTASLLENDLNIWNKYLFSTMKSFIPLKVRIKALL